MESNSPSRHLFHIVREPKHGFYLSSDGADRPLPTGVGYLDPFAAALWDRLAADEALRCAAWLSQNPLVVGSVCSGTDAFQLALEGISKQAARFH